jgi:adenine-specific DNA-methyltransferase
MDADIALADNIEYVSGLPSGSVKLFITSPPYGIGKEYEDQVLTSEYVETQKRVISLCHSKLKDDGSMCWQVGTHVSDGEIIPLDCLLFPIFSSLGMKCRNRVVWHYGHGLHCSKRFSGRHETILWFTKGDQYTFNLDAVRVPQKYPGKKYYKGPNVGKFSCNPLGANPSDFWEANQDVWDIPNVKSRHREKTPHPCQFPVELVARLILALSNPEDLVVDPYMGSGTTIVAALMHGRKAKGCDVVQEYVDIARRRVEALSENSLKVRPMGPPRSF